MEGTNKKRRWRRWRVEEGAWRREWSVRGRGEEGVEGRRTEAERVAGMKESGGIGGGGMEGTRRVNGGESGG